VTMPSRSEIQTIDQLQLRPGSTRMPAWKRFLRVGSTLLVVAVCLAYVLYNFLLAAYMVRQLNMNDFGKFYYSTRLFLDGQDMYGPSPATAIPVSETESRQFLNMNPPHFHLLMLPFAAFGPRGAFLLWVALNLIALLVNLRIIAQELRIHWTPRRVLWTSAGVLLCSATGTIAVTGQLTFLLLLPVTLAWISARHGSWSKAAGYLGVCASIKPFLGIFLIYLILRRDWKPVAVMAVSGAVCGITGLAIFGWTAYVNWLVALSSVDWTWASMNGSLAALVARAFGENPFYTPVVSAASLIRPTTTILTLAVVGVSFRELLRNVPPSADHVFGILLLTAQLVSPLGWIYYLWLILGPAVALYRWSESRASTLRDGLALLAVPGLVIPYLFTGLWNDSALGGLTLGSIYVWTTIFLWGTLVVDWKIRANASGARSVPVPQLPGGSICDSRRVDFVSQ